MVFEQFARLAGELLPSGAEAALELGAGNWTLLSAPAFARARRVALNLRFDATPSAQLLECEMVVGNANRIPFADASFDCVLSSSALEHDKYFWRTIAEVRRVLRKGGVFIVGVPIYKTLPTDKDFTTVTYARHGIAYNADYFRFSEQAVRELFFEDYACVTHEILVREYPNPYLVAAGRK
ncbi:MAG TPA: class I SAM-dependent methyltransferase [Ramlibacter sp.]|nr:class I SAM-dependent methyltransferase [Ramlibacter sp.]